MRVVDEACVRSLDLPATLHVHPVRAVDHDLGHGVVAEEPLERAVPEDVVRQLPDELTTLLARERRAGDDELLRDRLVDAVVEVGRLLHEELRAELGDARVMHPGLELGVRVDLDLCERIDDCDRAVARAGKTVVQAHYALAKERRRFRCAAFGSAFGEACLTRPDMARANSERGCASTIDSPRLTQSCTVRSSGSSWATCTRSPSSTSRVLSPTFALARFNTYVMRVVGNDSWSSVCSERRTFLSVGTSRPQRTSSWSVRSSVARTAPWKNGDVSTTIASYDDRATSSSAVTLLSTTSSASSGRSGAARTSSPHACRVTYPASFSESSSPGATTRSYTVFAGSSPSMIAASPNWRSRSRSSVRFPSCFARSAARLVATTVFPVPPFGEKTVTTVPRCAAVCSWRRA